MELGEREPSRDDHVTASVSWTRILHIRLGSSCRRNTDTVRLSPRAQREPPGHFVRKLLAK
jgi:hypothetical protein